jgi:hypothetical protein
MAPLSRVSTAWPENQVLLRMCRVVWHDLHGEGQAMGARKAGVILPAAQPAADSSEEKRMFDGGRAGTLR